MRCIFISTAAVALTAAMSAAVAQVSPDEAAAVAPAEPAAAGEHAGHTEAAAADEHSAHATGTTMPGSLGNYPMTREASGTSWQPEAAPMQMRHAKNDPWDLMTGAFITAAHTDSKGGQRGDTDDFVQSMAMLMAQRPIGAGTLGLRGMLSLDPALVGDDGYPLLFQTGETADGVTPLIDRQHPHDFFMELAATYSAETGAGNSAFVYAALAGEPALGPVTFMHRASGLVNPEAPLSHHWFDSTHISFGVLTSGVVLGNTKLEASLFNGREPDEERYNIETESLDSWSARVTWNPTPNWSSQLSFGSLEEPEQLEPGVDIERTTISMTYHRPLAAGWWQTTFAAGRNEKQPGDATDAWLLESALKFGDVTTVFARAESVDKDELFLEGDPLHHQLFRVQKLGIGAARDFATLWDGVLSAGLVYNWHFVPQALEPSYGGDPGTWLVFARWAMP